ncbi:uncharacterized protein LOC132609044 [Lycium barbarum]|uniref:uncharacterized protein LOC132609044 n=1 Tax=Lycium barbarum TaxID=112863 RepID=UPI00293F69EC|nr:uncharacterized protein LOC132609044 [Lycium barbarum]
MRKTRDNEFLYVFIALYAFIKGFECCRPIVVVDGSHLKTPYNGTFVSASTLDGAGNILPLAYGVIDSENDRSWTWFSERFRETYGIRENMCIVSYRHESINKVVCRIYPEVAHYACIWHLWGNVCKKYKKRHDVLSHVFYSMAKAYTQDEFDKLMGKVQKADMQVAEYLESVGRDKWARVYASVNRGYTMTSNIAECINRYLLAARELPIYDFLEEVEPSTEFVYTLHDGGRRFILNLNNKTCSCLKTYDVAMDPLPDEREWKIPKYILEDVVLPPRYKRPPGRPKKRRDKPLSELFTGKKRHACSTCRQLGHNRRSCSFEPRRK